MSNKGTRILKDVGRGTELAKRTYIDGVVVEKKCECGEILQKDLGSDYLSYPSVGHWQSLCFYCDECDIEYEQDVKVRILLNLEIKEE